MKPGAVVEHHSEEVVFILAAGAADAAAVLAADIDGVAQGHLGEARTAGPASIEILDQDTVVLMDAGDARVVN